MRLIQSVAAATVLSALAAGSSFGAEALSTYGVLAGSTITNTDTNLLDATNIYGNVGLSPGTDVTGFAITTIHAPYALHITDVDAAQAKSDLTAAYNILAATPTTSSLGTNIGNLGLDNIGTLTAGVYDFATSADLIGNLNLDAQGDPNAVFIFKVGTTLTTASGSSITLVNGALGANVFFEVGSSATLGTTTVFVGNILADQSITLDTHASITCGSALARIGAVTLDTNLIISSDDTDYCVRPTIAVTSTLPATATGNERAVGNAIDSFVSGGGVLPLAFQILATTSTPAELASAFGQLSGEAGAGVSQAGIQSTNSFLSLVTNSGFDSERTGPSVVTAPAENAAPASRPAPAPAPGSGTVKALDYGPEDSPNRVSAIFDSFDRSPAIPRRYDVWAAAFGGQDTLDGDASAGSHGITATNFGVAAGLDYRVTPDTKLGVALSTGRSSFDLADGFGGGSSNQYQAAVYGRTNLGPAYLLAALAYAWQDESTDRFITVGGDERLTAEFAAHDVAGQLETGYRLGWLTPFAAVRVQAFSTPAYDESSNLGASVFALDYEARTTTNTRTELGARVEGTVTLPDGDRLGLRASAAWAHDFWSRAGVVATFHSMPGFPFTVNGAAPASDSLLLSGGAELGFRNGFSVATWFDTALAVGSQSYSGNVRVKYAW